MNGFPFSSQFRSLTLQRELRVRVVSIVICALCVINLMPPSASADPSPRRFRRRTVKPRMQVEIKPDFEVLPGDLTMTVGEQATIYIRNSTVPLNEIDSLPASDALKIVPDTGRSFLVTALKPGDTSIAFSHPKLSSRTVRVKIEAPRAERVELNFKPSEKTMLAKGDTFIVRPAAKDKRGDNVPLARLSLRSDDPSTVLAQGFTLRGEKAGRIGVHVVDGASETQAGRVLETFEVEVYEPQIVFDNPHPIVREGRTTRVRASVLDHNGEVIGNARVTWKPASETDPVDIVQSDRTTVSLFGRKIADAAKPSNAASASQPAASASQPSAARTYQIVAKYKGTQQPLQARLLGRYEPLKTTLDVVDERTAKDLFGDQVAKEFFVVRLTLYNHSADEQVAGAPMLAFTDTMRIGVGLQKRVKSRNRNGAAWEPFTRTDYGLGADAASDLKCKHFLDISPQGQEMMRGALDSRIRRSRKERSLRFIDIFRTTASAVTGVAVPGSSSALIPALEKFSNGVLPGFEKFTNGVRGVGLTEPAMNLLVQQKEEIPMNREVTRFVLVSRKPIEGLLGDFDVRVSDICTHDHGDKSMRYVMLSDPTSISQPSAIIPMK